MSVIEDEERKAYYEAFSAFDWNNNGKISYKSLIFAMRRAGVNPTEVEVHDMINRLDNGTGVLSFDDFLKIAQAEVDEMIDTVDRNGDGKISYSEFRVMLGAIPLLME